jgi:hypothetical protein
LGDAAPVLIVIHVLKRKKIISGPGESISYKDLIPVVYLPRVAAETRTHFYTYYFFTLLPSKLKLRLIPSVQDKLKMISR